MHNTSCLVRQNYLYCCWGCGEVSKKINLHVNFKKKVKKKTTFNFDKNVDMKM